MTKERFDILLQQFKSDSLSPAEYEELMDSIDEGIFDQYAQEDILAALRLRGKNHLWTKEREKAVWNELTSVKTTVFHEHVSLPVKPIRRFIWYRVSAAAALFILFSTGIYMGIKSRSSKAVIAEKTLKNDVAPGHSGAVLTLSNGRKIILDSAGNGVLTSDANVSVIKKDGEITYQGKASEIVYNDVATAKGREWQLTLSDGTKVWLNSASSIHYPLTFTGSKRVVEITGEAYFEVAKNTTMPFIVTTKNEEITVLGTHFNINAYDDEDMESTTLLEGIVRVSDNEESATIRPGQQSSLNIHTKTIQVHETDVQQAVAWKNGYFSFSSIDIERMMRQLSRWYDVDVVYEGAIPKMTFSGEIGRNLTLVQLLDILNETRIHYRIEGKRIVIRS